MSGRNHFILLRFSILLALAMSFASAAWAQCARNVLDLRPFCGGPPPGGDTTTPDFFLTTDKFNSVVAPGDQTSYVVTVNDVNGFAGSVTLSASGLSASSNVTFSPNPTSGTSTMTVTNGTALGSFAVTVSGVFRAATRTTNVVLISSPPPVATQFVPVAPCRVVDTRNATGPFGGPSLTGGAAREFDIPNGACGIPSTAQAYVLNATVVPAASQPLGFLRLFPCGETQPFTSNLNSIDGRVKAVAAIVPAGSNGGVCAFADANTDLILDISGYFTSSTNSSALQFYPLPPCRVADTRNAPGPLGGPSLSAFTRRDFPVPISSCNVPPGAQAYSLNFTSVPQGSLGFLTAWPTGQAQPAVSTLNAPTGTVTANAAIVGAGANGDISVLASNVSDLVIDINGYFAPPSSSGLSFFPLTPCRMGDTRHPSTPPFNGTLVVDVVGTGCGVPPSGTPTSAKAYALNATVIPPGSLGFLTLWPEGTAQPLVSTLNAIDGAVTSNLALVPAGTNGAVDVFVSNPSDFVLDMLGYFAP